MDTSPEWTPEQREYLHTFLHEIKSPLLSVLGLAEGLANGLFGDEKVVEVVDILAESASHMEGVVEMLTATLRGPSARSVALTPEGLQLLVMAACSPAWVEAVGPLGPDRVTVQVKADSHVAMDPMRLRRIITNLVENALRHTTQAVEVIVEQRGLCLVIDVFDRGNGLSLEAMSGKGRSGLGINVVQNIVYSMRGVIEWLPREGGGTHVRAELPFSGQHQ